MAGFLGACVSTAGGESTELAEAEAFWERVLRADVSTTRDLRCSDLIFLKERSAGSSLSDLLRVLMEVSLDG